MSQSIGLLDKTFKAGKDLSSSQYYIVKHCGTGTPYAVELTSASTDKAIGILQNKPKMNEAATVRLAGTSKIVSSTPIAEGEYIMSDASGKAECHPADLDIVIAQALEPAAADKDIIEVLITHFTANTA